MRDESYMCKNCAAYGPPLDDDMMRCTCRKTAPFGGTAKESVFSEVEPTWWCLDFITPEEYMFLRNEHVPAESVRDFLDSKKAQQP